MTATTTGANPHAVGEIYAAFGRGDIPSVLDRLADDVRWDGDWADNFGQRSRIEHFLPRRGVTAVSEFFVYLAGCTVHDFQILDMLTSDRQVVVQVVIEMSLPNGGRFRDEELHLWTFGHDGRVKALRHYTDTAKQLAAAGGQDTTLR